MADVVGRPRLPIFSGKADDVRVEKFAAEAERAIANYAIDGGLAVEFVLRYLEGEARDDVLYLPEDQRTTATMILNHLREVYADTRSVSTLLTVFYSRCQQPGESFLQYSHALREIEARVLNKSREALPPTAVRDRFVEGIGDRETKRHLDTLVERRPDATLALVRQKATTWTRGGGFGVSQQQGTQQQASIVQAIDTVRTAVKLVSKLKRKRLSKSRRDAKKKANLQAAENKGETTQQQLVSEGEGVSRDSTGVCAPGASPSAPASFGCTGVKKNFPYFCVPQLRTVLRPGGTVQPCTTNFYFDPSVPPPNLQPHLWVNDTRLGTRRVSPKRA